MSKAGRRRGRKLRPPHGFCPFVRLSAILSILIWGVSVTPSALFCAIPAFSADDAFGVAERHFEGKNYVKALMLFENAVTQESAPQEKLARAYLNLGQCYHYLKRTDDAIAAFRAVSDSFPTTAYADPARKWLGDCYVLKNEFDTACPIFRDIVARHSDTAVAAAAHFELGRTLFLKKDYDLSLMEFNLFLENHPRHTQARQAKLFIQRIRRIQG